jgi:thiol:disulfide interchange protein DsbG
MPRLRHLLTLTLGTALLHLPSVQAAEELPAAIKQIEAKGAKIVGQFDAPDGLRGYAAQYQNRGMALYLTPDGKHVLLGNLYDADGKDLSSEPLQKLVYAPMAKEVWAKFEASNWIQDGNKDAPAHRVPVQRSELSLLQHVLGTGAAVGQGWQGAVAAHHGRHHSRGQPG